MCEFTRQYIKKKDKTEKQDGMRHDCMSQIFQWLVLPCFERRKEGRKEEDRKIKRKKEKPKEKSKKTFYMGCNHPNFNEF